LWPRRLPPAAPWDARFGPSPPGSVPCPSTPDGVGRRSRPPCPSWCPLCASRPCAASCRPSALTSRARRVAQFPAHAVRAVLDDDSGGSELVTQGIGGGEVLVGARGLALFEIGRASCRGRVSVAVGRA